MLVLIISLLTYILLQMTQSAIPIVHWLSKNNQSLLLVDRRSLMEPLGLQRNLKKIEKD